MNETYWDRVDAPWGRLTISVDARGYLTRVDVAGRPAPGSRDSGRCRPAAAQLAEYFDGSRQHFSLPLGYSGTAFQERVWAALRDIPYGQVVSYGELAREIGNPAAARAVGAANGANPLPIVIPCHRVIAAGGALGGYTGGLRVKRALLSLEGRSLAAEDLAA